METWKELELILLHQRIQIQSLRSVTWATYYLPFVKGLRDRYITHTKVSALECPLCTAGVALNEVGDECLSCPWVVLEGRICEDTEEGTPYHKQTSHECIARLNEWIKELEEIIATKSMTGREATSLG